MQVLITFLNWRQKTKSRNEMGWQSLHTSLLLSSMNIFPNIFQIFPGGLISCIASGLSLLPFCSLPGIPFLALPAFQGHGTWAPGSTQRMKTTPSFLKESGPDCGEDSLHGTVPARAGKGLSPFWESLWAYLTCVPSQALVLFCSLGRLWLCLYLCSCPVVTNPPHLLW